jgi:hypothetical protein
MRTTGWRDGCCLASMTKNSQVLFRRGSRLPTNLGLPADAVGTVICKYLISHPSVGSPERVDVRFEENKVAWGVPTGEFVLIEHTAANSETPFQTA